MPGKVKRQIIICRSQLDFERVFLPRAFERKELEKMLREPGGFGKTLERELIRCIRKERSGEGQGKR